MKKILYLLMFALIINFMLVQVPVSAFVRIVDVLFDGAPVETDKLQEVLETIKKNKEKNKNIKNPKKLKPDKLVTVFARQQNPDNIQLEIDTSHVIVKSDDDIQMPITNQGFLNAITEAIMVWDDADIATVGFAPLKFASLKIDPEDRKNIVSFRAFDAPEGVPDTPAFTVVNYARTNTVTLKSKQIMVKPGTILDADIIFDPQNKPCRALSLFTGDFKEWGDPLAMILENGFPTPPVAPDTPSQQYVNLQDCDSADISGGDITDLAVRHIAQVLGLEESAVTSAAASKTFVGMSRYLLTNDDLIGLANLYPDKTKLIDHGAITGRVLLGKKPVNGAHVVLEDINTGEPVVGVITNLAGRFTIQAVPAGFYNVYAEPLDGPVRKNRLRLNFFGSNPDLNFSTGVFPTPIIISKNKTTKIIIKVRELSASAFNINHKSRPITEKDIDETGGGFLVPIYIMPGQTLTDQEFWGDNISSSFGTLSVSGSGISVSNVRDTSIPVSDFVECEDCQEDDPANCASDPRCPPTQVISKEPDELQGFKVDIICAPGTSPGARNIIFTGEQIDITHPSFGLRDQITGGLVVTE